MTLSLVLIGHVSSHLLDLVNHRFNQKHRPVFVAPSTSLIVLASPCSFHHFEFCLLVYVRIQERFSVKLIKSLGKLILGRFIRLWFHTFFSRTSFQLFKAQNSLQYSQGEWNVEMFETTSAFIILPYFLSLP